MARFDSVEHILDFAIAEEQKASQFYTKLAEEAEKSWLQRAFREFAQEEREHEIKLQEIKAGQQTIGDDEKVQDLKIADYVIQVAPKPDMNFQDALILVMKKEKAAFKLYTDLAARISQVDLKQILLGLAQEEAKHKLRFEVEYDDLFST